MQLILIAGLIAFMLCVESPSHGQMQIDDGIGQTHVGALGSLPPDLLSKIQALAALLQQKSAEGKINDVTLSRQLQSGDAAGAIRGLGPDAERLLNEIQASFQSNYSEESLGVLLQSLTGASAAR